MPPGRKYTNMHIRFLSLSTILAASVAAHAGLLEDVQLNVQRVGEDLVSGVGPNSTYRVWVELPTNWSLDAVAGNATMALSLSVTGGSFYQNEVGGPTSTSINPAFFALYPDLEWDSFLTIGAVTNVDNDVNSIGFDFTDFELGFDVYDNDGGLFVLPPGPQNIPVSFVDDCGTALDGIVVGQFTLLGEDATLDLSMLLQGKDSFSVVWQKAIDTYVVGEDCDANGVLDVCDLLAGDCNANGLVDACEEAEDCNDNGIPDECESASDCNANGIPDECEASEDCNANGIPDECESHGDCNGNGTLDECESFVDCNANGIPDECDVAESDCNENGVPDECDVTAGTSLDENADGYPDECDPDCNGNGVSDLVDIDAGTSEDSNANGVPDECECDDIIEDGVIDILDLLQLLSDWGICPGIVDCPSDLDGDSDVGLVDLLILIEVFGAC
ncbi:MAG: hypothetical protein GY894_08945 [Planctomycetes bacterium]|nr:hypothetical protein [Planctomycetota bacterium]MCP4839469.1 hypothetical protein [Planctomycetota bacterium]